MKIKIAAGTKWAKKICYSRAIKTGNMVVVAGTAAVDDKGNITGVGDEYGQTRYILGKIEKALTGAGAKLEDVVRTRIFVKDISKWEEVGKAHGEFFKGINPVTTMVEVNAFIHPDILVEIEADAVVSC